MNLWIVMLLCLSSTTGQCQTAEFYASSFPSPFYFSTASVILLTCNIPSEYTFQHWVHPSRTVISNSFGRYIIERSPFHVNLRINKGTELDSGSYTCHATLNQVNYSTSITIYHENPIDIYSTSVNVTVNVGGSFTFFCNASNTMLRQWLYQMGHQRPKVLSNTTDGKVIITMDFELQLRNIALENEGIYECLLSNNLGRLYLTNNLSVTALPPSKSTNTANDFSSTSFTTKTSSLNFKTTTNDQSSSTVNFTLNSTTPLTKQYRTIILYATLVWNLILLLVLGSTVIVLWKVNKVKNSIQT